MRFTLTSRRNVIIGAIIVASTVTPAFAILGVGDIVFDPTSYAQLVSQLATVESQLRTMEANAKNFSTKSMWQTTLMALENVNVPNLFGETSGMSVALNTNLMTASTSAWKMSSVAVTNPSYLSTQTPGASAQLSSLAMVETSDSVSPTCLNAIGQYQSSRTNDAAASLSLQASQLDTTLATNSEVEQLNMLNASQAQQMTEIQAQGQLHACLAAQMTVANMQQRNAAAQSINDAAFVQQQRAANPTDAANESQTWDTYLP